MTPKITVKREGSVWAWFVKLGNRVLAGGYCRTKRDALSDATITMKSGGCAMKLFRSTTKIEGVPLEFVDWYEGETEEEARKCWAEDCHRYGLPMAKVTVSFVECDPQTHKPLKQIGGAQ